MKPIKARVRWPLFAVFGFLSFFTPHALRGLFRYKLNIDIGLNIWVEWGLWLVPLTGAFWHMLKNLPLNRILIWLAAAMAATLLIGSTTHLFDLFFEMFRSCSAAWETITMVVLVIGFFMLMWELVYSAAVEHRPSA